MFVWLTVYRIDTTTALAKEILDVISSIVKQRITSVQVIQEKIQSINKLSNFCLFYLFSIQFASLVLC